jgi:DNA-binding GntR family transcriptional regulator
MTAANLHQTEPKQIITMHPAGIDNSAVVASDNSRVTGGTSWRKTRVGGMVMGPEKLVQHDPIRREGFTESVFEYLRAEIISLRIPPDTRISIDSLARKLGVSQTPIREALRQLEAIGLVTKQHYVGYCSAPKLSRRQFDDLYEIRLQLEPYAARRAAERIDEETLARLRRLAAEMQPTPSQASYDHFAGQDSQLHNIVAATSGNLIIHDTLERLNLHFHIFRLRFHRNVTTEAVAEHAMLIDALGRRDPAGAELAMRTHIERSYQRLAAYAAAEGENGLSD